jgi:hypothetical protein
MLTVSEGWEPRLKAKSRRKNHANIYMQAVLYVEGSACFCSNPKDSGVTSPLL